MESFKCKNNIVYCWCNGLDKASLQQIENICTLPFVFHHLALMPDVHAGMGMPIGGVLPTEDVVIPIAVGTDIGCGLCAVKTNIKKESLRLNTLKGIIEKIRKYIPVGFNHQDIDQDEKLMPQGFDIDSLRIVRNEYKSALKQIGTLGGSIHFIELQNDEEGWLWIMLHSGSRDLGKQVCNHYNNKAMFLNEHYYSVVPNHIGLSFLPSGTTEFIEYWEEMSYCIEFARCNRNLMMKRVMQIISSLYSNVEFDDIIDIAHNYASKERHFGQNVIVHRKGAIKVPKGKIGIIPGSQGTCSYIVEGLGNPNSFCSASHGAGRTMNRMDAKRRLDLNHEITLMNKKGIIHNMNSIKDLEEAAGAYKDIDVVMANQKDLVKIVRKLFPLAVIKGK